MVNKGCNNRVLLIARLIGQIGSRVHTRLFKSCSVLDWRT